MHASSLRSGRLSRLAWLPLLLATAAPGLAHPGYHHLFSASRGFAHPFSGWDHILALVAVGVWAAQRGTSRALPALFLLAMAAGALAGHVTGVWPGLDQGIAASVFALGLLIATRTTVTNPVAYALVGLFAVFHGWAHGAEMPATAAGLSYGVGFLAASTLLIAGGVALGREFGRRSAWLPMLGGATLAIGGLALAVGG